MVAAVDNGHDRFEEVEVYAACAARRASDRDQLPKTDLDFRGSS